MALNAFSDRFIELGQRAKTVYGNAEEIQRLRDLDSPAFGDLEWESSTP